MVTKKQCYMHMKRSAIWQLTSIDYLIAKVSSNDDRDSHEERQ